MRAAWKRRAGKASGGTCLSDNCDVRPFESGLAKTRRSFLSRLKDLAVQPRLDEAYWEELEAILVGTDMSVSLVDETVARLRDREARFQLNGPSQVEDAL